MTMVRWGDRDRGYDASRYMPRDEFDTFLTELPNTGFLYDELEEAVGAAALQKAIRATDTLHGFDVDVDYDSEENILYLRATGRRYDGWPTIPIFGAANCRSFDRLMDVLAGRDWE